MAKRPYVLLSVAVSIDGRINDTTPGGLPLSNEADFDRVDQVRSECDAILIGAGTLRNDNPRMTIKSAARRAQRVAAGRPEHLVKVLLTGSGDLDPSFRWFHSPGHRIVYTTDLGQGQLEGLLGTDTEVVSLGSSINLKLVLSDLSERGIERLMVEGGEQVHTELLSQGLVDEIHFAVAPLLVGTGPRFLDDTTFPWLAVTRMEVAEVKVIEDVVLIRFLVPQL